MWSFILGAIVAWIVYSQFSKQQDEKTLVNFIEQPRHIDEENIQERQQRFEDFMVYSFVPTALSADERATYFLMKDWFVLLDERNRHDQVKQQQIRNDWLTYMYQLDYGATSHYLWMESQEEDISSRGHKNDARESEIRVHEIENRFAAMVGPDAEELLKKIRDKEFGEWMDEQRTWEEQLRIAHKKKEESKS